MASGESFKGYYTNIRYALKLFLCMFVEQVVLNGSLVIEVITIRIAIIIVYYECKALWG